MLPPLTDSPFAGVRDVANTFPSSGNAGIGTTTPDTPLTIDTGSTIGYARIRGRSPAWVAGSCGSSEAHVGLITVAGDGVTGSVAGDTFFLPSHNSGITFIGRTTGSAPVMAVHNAGANVAVGLGTAGPGGRFVAARPVTGGTGAVELQGNNATAGIRCLSLGYRGPYNGQDMSEAAFIQAERQGVEYSPIEVQPLGGVVLIGHLAGFGPPDVYVDGSPYIHRFGVNQQITDVANPSTNKFHIMATFEMESKIPSGDPQRDTGCGRFVIKQVDGGAWVRALECQAVRYPAPTTNARTWGLEVGCHNALRDLEAHVSVGIYVHSGNGSWWTGNPDTKSRRANTGILIEGVSSDGEGGWDQFVLFRQGNGSTAVPMFYVERHGNIWSNGTLTTLGNISNDGAGGLDITGSILSHADIAAFNTVQAGGDMYATSFVVTSSQALKENIVPLDPVEADALLTTLVPVRYNLKERPDRALMGFVAEDVGAPLAVNAKGVDVMAVVSTLAAVVRSQRLALNRLQARVDALDGGAVP
jgi:hypothetical protein